MLPFLSFYLFSVSTLACKPGGIDCTNKDPLTVDSASLDSLRSIVSQFQKLLSEHIPPGSAKDSCFNNHFANFYLRAISEPRTCFEQVQVIKRAVEELTNAESEEWKSIKSKDSRKKLENTAVEVRRALAVFLKNHSPASMNSTH